MSWAAMANSAWVIDDVMFRLQSVRHHPHKGRAPQRVDKPVGGCTRSRNSHGALLQPNSRGSAQPLPGQRSLATQWAVDSRTLDYYEAHADQVAALYESAPSPVARYFAVAFTAGSRVLDVGAGSGRDLAALVAAAYDGYGLEPSDGLRQAAMAHHPELAGRLAAGALPDTGTPFGGDFDGILCSAVLMHVQEADLFDAALSLRRLLKSNGRLLISLPTARTDVGTDGRDANGRLFTPYAPDEVQLLFERLGFQRIGRWETADALQRAGTRWVTLLLELRTGGPVRAVDQIEGILNRDRKVATYKFALFRALAEIATQESRAAQWRSDGRVGVPIERIAARWLLYYWPLFASARPIPQSQAEGAGNARQPVAFRAPLGALMRLYAGQGEHGGLTAWHLAHNGGKLSPEAAELHRSALRSIAGTIRSGPVTFAGGALETGAVFEFDSKSRSVVMAADLWRELCLLGHWIVDAVIVRWAALTERFAHRQGIHSGDVLPLLLATPEVGRVTALARSVYAGAKVEHCAWTGRSLTAGRFAVDHIIPFALWGNNDLWNLLSAHPQENGRKSDRLPSSELLLERRDPIVDSWSLLRDAMPADFDRQARNLLGSRPAPGEGWRLELFSRLREAVEVTALQRGVERWPGKSKHAEDTSVHQVLV